MPLPCAKKASKKAESDVIFALFLSNCFLLKTAVTSSSPTPTKWPVQALNSAIAPMLPGFTVEVLPEVDSSNSELMRRFKKLPPLRQPLLLLAEQQSAGRGRLGRSWQSQSGDSLTFSLGLPLQPKDWSGLSLVVGVSVAESLASLSQGSGYRIGLKWPNDLWLTGPEGERKLAGILVETGSWEGQRYVVIGVGINILPISVPTPAPQQQAMAAMAPACLQDFAPSIDAAQALLLIAPSLVQAVQAFEQFGFAPFQARFACHDVLAGREVRLSDASQGTAHGVTEDGALLVLTALGMRTVTSSEISVRPVSAQVLEPSAVANAKDTPSC